MSYQTALILSAAQACVLIALLVALRRGGPLTRTAWALAVNFALMWAYPLATERYSEWVFFLAVDALTARVVLLQPAGRWQAVVGFLLIVQCVMHVRYGIGVKSEQITSNYLDTLTAIGWGQLVALIGGATHERIGNIYRHYFVGRHHRTAAENGSARMGKTR